VAGFGEVELLEQLPGAAAGVRAREAGQPPHHAQVLLAGLQVVDRRVLAGEADTASDLMAVTNDVEARDPGLAGVRTYER
jgi:hypothetical protein